MGDEPVSCTLCGGSSDPYTLAEASWLAPEVLDDMEREHPDWMRASGACPACAQEALLRVLLARGDAALHEATQAVWPLDAEAAFGVLPTPLRMHADPRYTGRGVTLALVDSGFCPHPDLTQPVNRIRAWADASDETVRFGFFTAQERPRWPGSDDAAPSKWHGLMTSAVAAGNGRLSHGLYRGLASEADLMLVQVRGADGRITNTGIVRALEWLSDNGPGLGLRVVSLSVGGDPVAPGDPDPVDEAIARLVDSGVTVIAAAGNDGQRRLVPPASSPSAITVGGIDDKNTFDHAALELWHGNYGVADGGAFKPELVAPSIWVVAPLLPGTDKAREAADLFARRAGADPEAESALAANKFVTPHYHHVDGTSVAAPLVAAVAACMIQANPALTPHLVRRVLTSASRSVAGAPVERQGAGALDAGQAVARALREKHGALVGRPMSPVLETTGVSFLLHDHDVRQVRVMGSWNGWRAPGLTARLVEPGLWRAELPDPGPGRHVYKFLLDGTRWLADPDNPKRTPDGSGGLNSVLIV